VTSIHFWAADEEGQAFWRMQLPGEALRRRGHDVTIGQAFTAERQGGADVVVGPRICEPAPTAVWQRLAAEGRTLVYDVDDDYLNVDATNADAVAYYSNPERRARLVANIEAATVVTCVSQRLADTYRRHNPNTVVVPNGLPAHVLDWRRPILGPVTLGWAGSSSTLPELGLIGGRVRRFCDRNPDVRVRTVGVRPRDLTSAGLRSDAVEYVGWRTPGEEYLRACQGFDVWLAPYRSTEFNRCKAATKAIEAAALGIPIIASAIEPYGRHVEHGITGFLVHRDHEWDRYMRQLTHDADLRMAMGKAARDQARSSTIEQIAPQWGAAMGITAEVAA
jgi:glycosyltransferase involved in cell wall biosynthesis